MLERTAKNLSRLHRALQTEGYEVTAVDEPLAVGLSKISAGFDLVLVDRKVSPRLGRKIAAYWSDGSASPIVLLPTAFCTPQAWLEAVERALVEPEDRTILIADLTIDRDLREVCRNGRRIHLTKREYELLEFLSKHKGRVLSREQIQRGVWGDDTMTSNTVDVHVAKLRKKIDASGETPLIQTVVGFGYVLRGFEAE